MSTKIGGDTLALDADIRRQIETQVRKLADRFPDEGIDANVTIQEEFDPLHGHRVRCELSIKLGSGRRMVLRDASKTPSDAILTVFASARRSVRKLRRRDILDLSPVKQPGVRSAQVASR